MAVNGDAFSMSAFTGHTNWVEFCEHQASIAAEEFSRHVAQFLHDNATGDRQLTRRDFLNKFIDCFQRHFDSTQVLQLLVYIMSYNVHHSLFIRTKLLTLLYRLLDNKEHFCKMCSVIWAIILCCWTDVISSSRFLSKGNHFCDGHFAREGKDSVRSSARNDSIRFTTVSLQCF